MACGKKHKRTGGNGKGKKIGIPIDEYHADIPLMVKWIAYEQLEKMYPSKTTQE